MLRKDYLLKQFESFGKVLASILGLKKNLPPLEFDAALNDLSKQYNGKTLDDLLKAEHFDEILQQRDPLVKKITGVLMYEKLLLLDANGQTQAADKLAQQCLEVYRSVQNDLVHNEFDMDVHYKIQELLKRSAS